MTDARPLALVPTEVLDYPPEPWELRGQLQASLFLVPLTNIPVDLPPGCRPVRLGQRGVVAAVWVAYEAGRMPDYRELMTMLLVRRGLRLLPTITHIWVDSPVSRAGGRALWGIPKELASFVFDAAQLSARDEGGPLATATVRPALRLPGRWPLRFSVVQRLAGQAKISAVRSTARVAFAHATFDADPSGPLAFLAGCRPVISVTLGDFRMTIGAR
jgi:hypothetical protein